MATEEIEAEVPPPPPITLADIKEKLSFRGYTFEKDDQSKLMVTVQNTTAEEQVTLELATDFQDESGTSYQRSPWSRITLSPGQNHQYVAQTGAKWCESAALWVRLVEENNTDK